jgi:hypothetical protein
MLLDHTYAGFNPSNIEQSSRNHRVPNPKLKTKHRTSTPSTGSVKVMGSALVARGVGRLLGREGHRTSTPSTGSVKVVGSALVARGGGRLLGREEHRTNTPSTGSVKVVGSALVARGGGRLLGREEHRTSTPSTGSVKVVASAVTNISPNRDNSVDILACNAMIHLIALTRGSTAGAVSCAVSAINIACS